MENTNENKFQKNINFCLKYGSIIISLITILIGILSIFITAYFNTTFYHQEEKTSFKYSFGILEIILTTIVTILILFLSKKVLKKTPSKFLLIPILVCSLGLYIYWINALKLSPQVDQGIIHEMAISLLNGELNYFTQASQYLFLFPYQFGFTFFVAFVYKIFGTNFIYIEYLNTICSIINMILLFNISKLLFKNENVQKLLCFLLAGFSLYWMFFNVHFYGNILGLTLALLATLFTLLYLEKDKLRYLFFSGITIFLAITIKTNYSIFLCAIIVILILNTIKKWNKKVLLTLPFFLLTYLVLNLAYQPLLKCYTIDTSKGVPMINFIYMGMAEPKTLSPGWFTADHQKLYINSNYDKKTNLELVSNEIQERIIFFIKNPKEFLDFYSQKIGSTWLNPTFQTVWCSLPGNRYTSDPEYAHYLGYHETALSMVGGNLYKIEENYFNIYQILIFILASIGLFKINNNQNNLKLYLLPITFIGGFLFHLIWETKAIYVIQYYFILLPYSAFGLNYIGNLLTTKNNSK